jgi:hypothetical protein
VCQLEKELITVKEELAEAKAWKESMMRCMPPMQEIGSLLGVPLGIPIHDKILPGIRDLKAEVEMLRTISVGVAASPVNCQAKEAGHE